MVTKHHISRGPDPDEPEPDEEAPPPPPDEEHLPPADASSLRAPDAAADAPTWNPEYRSALDNPRHPLHHLKDA